jgi:type II secretory pathway component GspD/PulD (secretin)
MGSRVPVATGSGSSNMPVQWQYIDVGTNIDCRASQAPDGRYRLSLMMERSWVEGQAAIGEGQTTNSEARVGEFREPIIRQFKSESEVIIRDGQTLETNFATDPVSGKVIKLEVTLDVPK